MSDPVAQLTTQVADAAASLSGSPVDLPPLERPPKPEFGDYSTNAAMLLAPTMGAPPRQIAEQLGEKLTEALAGDVERVDVAGPGFLNLFMSDAWLKRAVADGVAAGERSWRGQRRASA